MYIKKIVVVGLLLATVNASQAASPDYRAVALKVYPLLADSFTNAAAVQEVKNIGACLTDFDGSNADQVGALALALGGKSHGLPGLAAFYDTATADKVVTGWRPSMPSSASVRAWMSDHSAGLTGAGLAVGLGVAGYKFGFVGRVKGLLPSRS